VRAIVGVPVVLLVIGVLLVVVAILRDEATVGLAIVIPFVVGSSLLFLVGVLLIVAGFFALPLAFTPLEDAGPAPDAGTEADEDGSWGGVVLVGPLPLFFGRWKNARTRVRVIAALVGAALLVAVVVLAVYLER
jgi:uncharacterized protein (TIGR00304 family)